MQEQGLPPEFSQYIPDILEAHAAMVARAFLALPFAAVLGAALAFRPRRRGTPPRSAPVIQTQIMLSIVGAIVMLIVGASLARAFGIVGVASLIRYRTKIDDPKDAVVMLASLTIGLASGVELYGLALFSTLFILLLLWIVESLEAEPMKTFDLKIVGADTATMRPRSRRSCAGITSPTSCAAPARRRSTTKPACRSRRAPIASSTAILALGPSGEIEVVWDDKKKK